MIPVKKSHGNYPGIDGRFNDESLKISLERPSDIDFVNRPLVPVCRISILGIPIVEVATS
jgi:hypothetical protein